MGLLLGLAVLIAGIGGLYRRDGEPALFPAVPGEGVQTYILDNGFHTDLVLPRAMVTHGALGQAVDSLEAGDWVYVGWGDAHFYVEEGPARARWRDGLRALFGRDNPSVVRLYAGGDPSQTYAAKDVQALTLSKRGLERLIQRVNLSLTRDPKGEPVLVKHRASDGAYFWHSHEAFWIGHLCNHWTLEALEAAGITVWPWRLMTSGEVMRTAGRAQLKAAKLDLEAQAH